MDKELQEIVKKLLTEKTVDLVIGYEKGYDELHTKPVFIKTPEDAGKLVFNKFCLNNLAVYLYKFKKTKIGIVAKGCDVKSIREMIKERQINRENVKIIGVVCENVSKKETALEKCKSCDENSPKNTDFLVGGAKDFPAKQKDLKDVEAFEKLTPKEKENFWKEQFDKCIRCYACRNVCPVCYCPDCFAQRNIPEYLNKKVADAENKLFQLIRMQHVFGRCTDCRACDTACPVGIPLHLITKKISKDAFELFGYTSGTDETTRTPLSTYKQDEELEEIY
jgi:formate dehydrogenase (coenzyme F420) beta subunit